MCLFFTVDAITCATGEYESGQTCKPCGACEEGKYRTGCGSISGGTCSLCESGKYKNTGITGSYNDQCKRCEAGKYTNKKGQTQCAVCPTGKAGSGGTACEHECAFMKAVSLCKCAPWYYRNKSSTVPICVSP